MKRAWMGCMAAVLAVSSLGLPLSSGAWAADTSISQSTASDTVSLDVKDVDIRTALQALFRNTGKNYAIDANVVGQVPAMSMKDVPFESALKSLTRACGLVYRLENNVYVISKRAEVVETVTPPPSVDSMVDIDVVSSEEIVIDKVPLNYSSASEILAAMSGDTNRLYGGMGGSYGGWGGNNYNNGYGGYNNNYGGGFGGYGGYGGGGYGGYGNIGNVGFGGGFGSYGGFGGGYGGYGNTGGFTYGGRSYNYNGSRH